MKYISTRGQAPALGFEDTMLTGLARDGGLYVPESVPQLSPEEIAALARVVEPTRYTRDDDGGVVEETSCDADDTFFALLKFANGAVGNLLFSWAGHGEATGFDGGTIGSTITRGSIDFTTSAVHGVA